MKNAERRTADTHAAEITQATAPEQLTQLENAAKIARAKANIIKWANTTDDYTTLTEGYTLLMAIRRANTKK